MIIFSYVAVMGFHSHAIPHEWTEFFPPSAGASCSLILETSLLSAPLNSAEQLNSVQSSADATSSWSRSPSTASKTITAGARFASFSLKCVSLYDVLLMSLHGWFQDIMAYNNAEAGSEFPFPIIADDRRNLVEMLGMLDPEEKDQTGMPLSARCVSALHAWIKLQKCPTRECCGLQ